MRGQKKGTQETLGGLSKKVASSSFPTAKFTRLCNYAGTYAREARIVNLLKCKSFTFSRKVDEFYYLTFKNRATIFHFTVALDSPGTYTTYLSKP